MILKKLFCVLLFVLIFFTSVVFASAKEDLIIAINKTYYVNGESFILPDDIRLNGINYLRTHYFTEDQCLEILKYIDEAIALANEIGTTDLSKISDEDINRGMAIVSKAVAIADSAPLLSEMKDETPKQDELINNKEKVEEQEEIIKEEITVSDTKEDDISSEVKKNIINEEKEVLTEVITPIIDDENVEQIETKNDIYDDGIDYSKYLNENQFEDVEFSNLKEVAIKTVAEYSIKKFWPIFIIIFTFCLIIIIVVIKLHLGKKKEDN